jgi:hypothetical protein
MAASRDCIIEALRWLIFLVGCGSLHSSFECRSSDQCSGGICEATGFCSFSDGKCASGQRYGHFSGALADQCTDGGVDLGLNSDGGDGGAIATGCALQIGGGGAHACAIVSDGTVECWGAGQSGQLGGVIDQSLPQPVLDAQSRPLKAATLALGGTHSCAVSSSSTISCWGENARGQLGTGAPPTPQPVPLLLGINPIEAAAAGGAHTCAAVGSSNLLWCWGANDEGQLSDGASGDANQPQAALARDSTQLSVDRIALGRAHSCALIGGHIDCWGRNVEGQLGTTAPPPAQVSGLGRVIAVAAGGDRTCAIVDGGDVFCWGGGQMVPTQVPGVTAKAIAVADDHVCAALVVGGGVVCWGAQPQEVLDLDGNPLAGVVEIVAGTGYSCARTSGGAVLCWGAALTLGDGSTSDRSRAGPVRLTCP